MKDYGVGRQGSKNGIEVYTERKYPSMGGL